MVLSTLAVTCSYAPLLNVTSRYRPLRVVPKRQASSQTDTRRCSAVTLFTPCCQLPCAQRNLPHTPAQRNLLHTPAQRIFRHTQPAQGHAARVASTRPNARARTHTHTDTHLLALEGVSNLGEQPLARRGVPRQQPQRPRQAVRVCVCVCALRCVCVCARARVCSQ